MNDVNNADPFEWIEEIPEPIESWDERTKHPTTANGKTYLRRVIKVVLAKDQSIAETYIEHKHRY